MIRKQLTLLPLVAVLAVLVLPASALAQDDQPASSGKDQALARLEAATQQTATLLTELLATLPESAHPGIQKALQASAEGLQQAMAALSASHGLSTETSSEGPEATGNAGESGEMTDPAGAAEEESGFPGGNETALQGVSEAFERSLEALEKVKAQVPEQAVASVEAAMQQVADHRAIALDNLTMARPEAPERPQRPERPRRPERPESPERPQQPERPERPERPEPPRP